MSSPYPSEFSTAHLCSPPPTPKTNEMGKKGEMKKTDFSTALTEVAGLSGVPVFTFLSPPPHPRKKRQQAVR